MQEKGVFRIPNPEAVRSNRAGGTIFSTTKDAEDAEKTVSECEGWTLDHGNN